jgi:hypothetical protein
VDSPSVVLLIAELLEHLGDDVITAAWSHGGSMTFDQALTFALEEPIQSPIEE